MDFIRIGRNKLKIMLTAEDAARYRICFDTANLSDAITKNTFRHILEEVDAEGDFDTGEHRLYIQIFPSKEGGCELFVTRLGVPVSEETDCYEDTLAQRKTLWLPAAKEYSLAFSFPTAEALLDACHFLKEMKIKGESAAFHDEDGREWLLFTLTENSHTPAEVISLLSEFGKSENPRRAELYLPEHAACLCRKEAVKTLGNL